MPKLTPIQQIKQLKRENEQLRIFMHEMIDLAFGVINRESPPKTPIKEEEFKEKTSGELTTCFGCQKLFDLAKDANPEIETETGHI